MKPFIVCCFFAVLCFAQHLAPLSGAKDEPDNRVFEPIKQSRIELVSPNGKHRMLLDVTDDGPAIWITNGKTGEDISIVALSNIGTYIGVRKDRNSRSSTVNLALAIDSKTGSPYIQFHDQNLKESPKMFDMNHLK